MTPLGMAAGRRAVAAARGEMRLSVGCSGGRVAGGGSLEVVFEGRPVGRLVVVERTARKILGRFEPGPAFEARRSLFDAVERLSRAVDAAAPGVDYPAWERMVAALEELTRHVAMPDVAEAIEEFGYDGPDRVEVTLAPVPADKAQPVAADAGGAGPAARHEGPRGSGAGDGSPGRPPAPARGDGAGRPTVPGAGSARPPDRRAARDGRGGPLPFWRRGLAVLAIAVVVGPLLGALALALAEAALAGLPLSMDRFLGGLRAALGLALVVGVPFALAAGAVMAAIVARRGTIGYGASAAVAFLTPCLLGLPVLGGFVVLAPFIGFAAAAIVLVVRALVGRLAAPPRRDGGVGGIADRGERRAG